jgi:hypothetical protein
MFKDLILCLVSASNLGCAFVCFGKDSIAEGFWYLCLGLWFFVKSFEKVEK